MNSPILNTINNNQDSNLSSISFKWDLKNLEIKTRSVEKTLEPLVIQVSWNKKITLTIIIPINRILIKLLPH